MPRHFRRDKTAAKTQAVGRRPVLTNDVAADLPAHAAKDRDAGIRRVPHLLAQPSR